MHIYCRGIGWQYRIYSESNNVCDVQIEHHDAQKKAISQVIPSRWSFRRVIRQISYANFNLPRRRRRNKKKGVWTVRWIAFCVLQHFQIGGAHDKANAGLMNNNLQLFDQNWEEAVVPMDEEIKGWHVDGIFMEHT